MRPGLHCLRSLERLIALDERENHMARRFRTQPPEDRPGGFHIQRQEDETAIPSMRPRQNVVGYVDTVAGPRQGSDNTLAEHGQWVHDRDGDDHRCKPRGRHRPGVRSAGPRQVRAPSLSWTGTTQPT
ncbi:hypothetical protein FRACA_1180003 [Frankia canadensis]|uniref:Uncharacterized protein n=1 Tax=Frankia canadensis TaxID=1836972 RepID=A0A2I2KJS1_9ACTN|nr:hypothetical protein FRACA_1180003 [Frankia canadensis]SOU53195.1 hypothetical protein FRACA_1180003 [Frankia canadensis]